MSKILFLTTAHHYNDDRIFFHQATALVKMNYEVKICSLSSDFIGEINSIQIESIVALEKSSGYKINKLLGVCESYQPDCIICSEPIPVFAASKFRKKKKVTIIYDITEWYPAMSMLRDFNPVKKLVQGVKFFLIQLYAGFLSNHFIFGEETKKFPLYYFFPFKKSVTIPYYPDEKYVLQSKKSFRSENITLCYTGAISEDKGIGRFFRAVDILQKRNLNLQVKILIVGSARKAEDEIYFSELLSRYSFKSIEIRKPAAYEKFSESFSDADICFDLRAFNFENHHSLPIKLFYYLGAGKPVIYSNLKGIRQHISPFDFGFLVDPEDAETIADCIEKYIKEPKLYNLHSDNAVKSFLEKYNWNVIRDTFVKFISKSLPKNTE